ncbi:MAG: acylphosphatase [Selenomonadaceae bacterium]|nr:acylphosphatase [Selenomonadaceae bacterium]
MATLSKLLITLAVLLTLTTSTNAAARIDVVESKVTSETSLPPMVKERMEESVAAIGRQLLLGRPLPVDEDWNDRQESTIHLVFDKILVGYTVKQVNIQYYGTEAIVNVKLLPWTDTIQNIQVNTNIEGMPKELEGLVANDLITVAEVFSDGLKGLPIAATDWTNGILKRRLNKFMEESLPEFKADFDVKIKNESNVSTAVVDLTVYPKLPVVRTISLSMRSDTIPNVALVTHRTLMEDKVNVLIGVPVAFIERHKADIETMLAKPLDEQTDFRVLKIKSNVTLTASEQMGVMIRSDSSRYRMRASGWVDIGRDERATDDVLFRMHIGRKISNLDETFFQIDIKPQEVKWNWSLGYSRSIFKNTSAALRYDFTDEDIIADLEYEFFKDWLLRYEHKLNNDRKEAAVRYKLHDFLGVEYVIDQRESWLRFIGNF